MAKRRRSKKELNDDPKPRPKEKQVISLATNLRIDPAAYRLLKQASERAEAARL